MKHWKGGQGGRHIRNVGWNRSEPWPYYGVPQALAMFNKYCRGDKQPCRVVCHSTGCPITLKILDKYNGNYNILYVVALGSAEGGSEMANALATDISFPDLFEGVSYFLKLIAGSGAEFLTTGYVRDAYDHNDTDGVPIYAQAGRKGLTRAGVFAGVAGFFDGDFGEVLIGEDDGAVAFHSACGYRSRFVDTDVCSGHKECVEHNLLFWCSKYKTYKRWSNHYVAPRCGRNGCDVDHGTLSHCKRYHSRKGRASGKSDSYYDHPDCSAPWSPSARYKQEVSKMTRDKKRIITAATIALILLATVAFIMYQSSEPATFDPSRTGGSGSVAPPFESGTDIFAPPARAKSVSGKQIIQHYLRWFRYPPNSRPLDGDMDDVVHPYRREQPFTAPLYKKPNGKIGRAPFVCRLQPDAHTITGHGPLRIVLRCSMSRGPTPDREGEQGVGPRPRVKSVVVNRLTRSTLTRLPASQIKILDSDGTSARPDELIFLFRPTKRDWGYINFQVDFQLEHPALSSDAQATVFHSRTMFFSSPGNPAFFTGQFREEVREGSLVVEAEVRVNKAGHYEFKANLRNEEKYIAAAKKEIKLRRGRHWVPLQFFGKIFHESNAPGPYLVTDFRGLRHNGAIDPDRLKGSVRKVDRYLYELKRQERLGAFTEPNKEVVRRFAGMHKTRAYALKDFSKEEWRSEFKTKRLAYLRRYFAAEE